MQGQLQTRSVTPSSNARTQTLQRVSRYDRIRDPYVFTPNWFYERDLRRQNRAPYLGGNSFDSAATRSSTGNLRYRERDLAVGAQSPVTPARNQMVASSVSSDSGRTNSSGRGQRLRDWLLRKLSLASVVGFFQKLMMQGTQPSQQSIPPPQNLPQISYYPFPQDRSKEAQTTTNPAGTIVASSQQCASHEVTSLPVTPCYLCAQHQNRDGQSALADTQTQTQKQDSEQLYEDSQLKESSANDQLFVAPAHKKLLLDRGNENQPARCRTLKIRAYKALPIEEIDEDEEGVQDESSKRKAHTLHAAEAQTLQREGFVGNREAHPQQKRSSNIRNKMKKLFKKVQKRNYINIGDMRQNFTENGIDVPQCDFEDSDQDNTIPSGSVAPSMPNPLSDNWSDGSEIRKLLAFKNPTVAAPETFQVQRALQLHNAAASSTRGKGKRKIATLSRDSSDGLTDDLKNDTEDCIPQEPKKGNRILQRQQQQQLQQQQKQRSQQQNYAQQQKTEDLSTISPQQRRKSDSDFLLNVASPITGNRKRHQLQQQEEEEPPAERPLLQGEDSCDEKKNAPQKITAQPTQQVIGKGSVPWQKITTPREEAYDQQHDEKSVKPAQDEVKNSLETVYLLPENGTQATRKLTSQSMQEDSPQVNRQTINSIGQQESLIQPKQLFQDESKNKQQTESTNNPFFQTSSTPLTFQTFFSSSEKNNNKDNSDSKNEKNQMDYPIKTEIMQQPIQPTSLLPQGVPQQHQFFQNLQLTSSLLQPTVQQKSYQQPLGFNPFSSLKVQNLFTPAAAPPNSTTDQDNKMVQQSQPTIGTGAQEPFNLQMNQNQQLKIPTVEYEQQMGENSNNVQNMLLANIQQQQQQQQQPFIFQQANANQPLIANSSYPSQGGNFAISALGSYATTQQSALIPPTLSTNSFSALQNPEKNMPNQLSMSFGSLFSNVPQLQHQSSSIGNVANSDNLSLFSQLSGLSQNSSNSVSVLQKQNSQVYGKKKKQNQRINDN